MILVETNFWRTKKLIINVITAFWWKKKWMNEIWQAVKLNCLYILFNPFRHFAVYGQFLGLNFCTFYGFLPQVLFSDKITFFAMKKKEVFTQRLKAIYLYIKNTKQTEKKPKRNVTSIFDTSFHFDRNLDVSKSTTLCNFASVFGI